MTYNTAAQFITKNKSFGNGANVCECVWISLIFDHR